MQFWRQSMNVEPDAVKIKQKVKKNYTLELQVLRQLKTITKEFKESPTVLIDLISSYSELALNIKIRQTRSPFHFFAKEYQKLLTGIPKKDGQANAILKKSKQIENENGNDLNKYSLKNDIGVFMINVEEASCKIEWANNYFWHSYG